MDKKVVSKYFTIITIAFAIYLIVLSIVGFSRQMPPFFYYGFWMTLGVLIGFRLCSFIYEKELDKEAKKKNSIFKDRIN